MSSKIPTAEEFSNKISEDIINNSLLDEPKNEDILAKGLIEFAKLHVEAAIKAVIENTGFEETTQEDLDSEEYKPFLTEIDGTIWTIDINAMELAYPLENIK